MFTGIIEEVGHIVDIEKNVKSARLHIGCKDVLVDTKTGDSIAVNGVCLTVTGMSEDGFFADVMSETISRSSLGGLKRGSRVNLERAMSAGGRFGGHIVSGHIDNIGKILSITKDENAVWYKISADEEILRFIVEKGSIAIDGISLTVAKVTDDSFSVSVIPHTLSNTILPDKAEGDIVNLETDILAKYMDKLLSIPGSKNESMIDVSFLRENGFL